MTVRIYQPAKNAMQSGQANGRKWVLEHEPASPKEIDGLMGWVGSRDTVAQIKLKFATKEEAVAYAERKGYAFQVIEENQSRRPQPKNYSDNFKFDKLEFGRA